MPSKMYYCSEQFSYKNHAVQNFALLTQRAPCPAMLADRIQRATRNYATELLPRSAGGKEMASEAHTLWLSYWDKCS